MNKERADSKAKNGRNFVLPGDRLATIEEFEAGVGSTTLGERIVASRVGEVRPDMANRVMLVKPAKEVARLPLTDDYIIGTVESASSSVAQVSIRAINDVESNKEFSAMLSLRDDRHRRSGPALKASDLIRAKIMSTTNSIYQLSLDCERCGVIYTVCSVCGGSVVALGQDRIKCRECGTVDERLLSADFVTYSLAQGNA
ncbi:MAG: exosome complex RNA-binding protein Csl4 [Nitrososphaerales archaeon]